MKKEQAFWDEEITETELKQLLSDPKNKTWARYAGKVLREKRPDCVWNYLEPADVAKHWSEITPYLGRRRALWKHIFSTWEEAGYVKRSHSAA